MSQLFVIDAPMNKVSEVDLPMWRLKCLAGPSKNRFRKPLRQSVYDFVVRGCSHPDGSPMTDDEAMEEVHNIQSDMASLGANRFPNWIGPQRSARVASSRPMSDVMWSTKIGNRR